jgi:hypothetical protein
MQVKQMQEARLDITNDNQMYQALYRFLANIQLNNGDLTNAVKHGYNSNVSCFGIINILSTIFAEPEDKLYCRPIEDGIAYLPGIVVPLSVVVKTCTVMERVEYRNW